MKMLGKEDVATPPKGKIRRMVIENKEMAEFPVTVQTQTIYID